MVILFLLLLFFVVFVVAVAVSVVVVIVVFADSVVVFRVGVFGVFAVVLVARGDRDGRSALGVIYITVFREGGGGGSRWCLRFWLEIDCHGCRLPN